MLLSSLCSLVNEGYGKVLTVERILRVLSDFSLSAGNKGIIPGPGTTFRIVVPGGGYRFMPEQAI